MVVGMSNEARVICWTDRDGVTNVTDIIPMGEALALAATLREANPAWLHVDVEAYDPNPTHAGDGLAEPWG